MAGLLTEREIRALAESFDRPEALMILEQAEIPRAQQPSWTSTPISALEVWRAVNKMIERENLTEARRRILEEACIERPGRLEFRPGSTPAGTVEELRISDDERRKHQRMLDKAARQTGYTLTEVWTKDELTDLGRHLYEHRKDPGVSTAVNRNARERLKILIKALDAWALLRDLGVTGIREHLLVQIYWRTVNGVLEPRATLEHMLVSAAGVRDDLDKTVTKALVRFVADLTSHCGISPYQSVALSNWYMKVGQSVDDAEVYRLQMGRPSWLLIDLGDEPRAHSDRNLAPYSVRGALYTADGQAQSWTKKSPHGPKEAMRLLLEEVEAESNVVVDLALPTPLMVDRVEHWDVVRSGADYKPLSAEYDIRLRWSLRLHQRYDHRRLPDGWRSTWSKDPCEVARDLLTDQERLTRWLSNREHDAYPFLMVAASEANFDPLPMLLAYGSRFIIWLWPEADPAVFPKLAEITRSIPVEIRRLGLPEQIARGDRKTMSIIWDDPDGREGYAYSLSGFLAGSSTERK